MKAKFTNFILFILLFIIVFDLSATRRDNYDSKPIDGSETGKLNRNYKKDIKPLEHFSTLKTSSYIISYNLIGQNGFYDLQSNASPNQIWQNPLNPDNVHIAFMNLSAFPGTRLVRYAYSSDRGISWNLLNNVNNFLSGFPSIDGFTDNSIPVISMHTIEGLSAARTQFFIDQGLGAGSFTRIDPGPYDDNVMIWGRVITTGSSLNPVKFINASSENQGLAQAALVRNSGIVPPGIFSGWSDYVGDNNEQYAFARSESGKIGHAFMFSENICDGCVGLRESTNGGLSWTGPDIVYIDSAFVDPYSAVYGISITYDGEIPCIVFELDNIESTYLFYNSPSYIMYWNPTQNNAVPRILAGPDNVPFHPNTGPTASNGRFSPLCRPVIGSSTDVNRSEIYVAFSGATGNVSPDQNVYYAVYFTMSYDGGISWSVPEKITPELPLKDYRYISMSHTNSPKNSSFGSPSLVQMTVQAHDYAGTFAPNQPPGISEMFGITLEVVMVNIKTISDLIPENFSLKQNYPNPFNPVTSIQFDVKEQSNITLKIYNSSGQHIQTIIDNKLTSPGTKEVKFTITGLASGIYFYTLTAKNFTDSKKMILIK